MNGGAKAPPFLWVFAHSRDRMASALDLVRLKASRASQGDEAGEVPLSERSEFGRRASSIEKHRGPIRHSRSGWRQARAFGSFWPFKRHSGAPRTKRFALDFFAKPKKTEAKLPRLSAAHFCLGKSRQNRAAGHEPARWSRAGALRFSACGARGPNSLRSDKGRSPAPPSCDARLALRLGRATAAAGTIHSNRRKPFLCQESRRSQ